MGFSTPPGHRNPTYDENTNGLVDQAEGVNVPNWEEDPNSPVTATGTSSVTVPIATTREYFLVYIKVTDTGGASDQYEMQVNGDTGSNYVTTNYDGTQTFGTTAWTDLDQTLANETTYSAFTLSGEWAQGAQFLAHQNTPRPGVLSVGGRNLNVSPPLTQFTIQRSAAADFEIQVFGRDLP